MNLVTKRQLPLLIIVSFVLFLTFGLTACGNGDETLTPNDETAVSQIIAEPTETTVPPTATESPTSEPTNTPTPEPTATESPTPTLEPTATESPTPEPTATESPTPEPTATKSPTPAPPTPVPATSAPATAVSDNSNDNSSDDDSSGEDGEEELPDDITVYYISNPNDILGVFPVKPFDADSIRTNMNNIQGSLYTMQANLTGAKEGDAAACTTYINAYNNILYSGIFYDPVPPEWQDIDDVYFISFIFSLDRTRPAYLSCVDSGGIDDFNHGLAYQTIDQTLNFLNPAITSAAGR